MTINKQTAIMLQIKTSIVELCVKSGMDYISAVYLVNDKNSTLIDIEKAIEAI